MLKASPLLLIGIVLFLWARGMTNEDFVMVGLGKSGHLELRSAAAAVSLSASPGMHKLGKVLSFEHVNRKIQAGSHSHKGFNWKWKSAFDWELRVPLLAVMGLVIAGLVILMKVLKNR